MTPPDAAGAGKPLSRPEPGGAPSLPSGASVDFALALLKDKRFARARMLLEDRCRHQSADAQCWFL
ncbi:MAG: hypothetical protein ACRET1_03155, partial [Burkholderiales bacterium]